MATLDQLEPASKADVMIYLPYHKGGKPKLLPKAISLYQKGNIEGKRNIEGGDAIPFVATWFVSKLPVELTRIQIVFDGNADLSYQMSLQNSEFIDHLIELFDNFNSSQVADFPKSFYQRLLNATEVS